MPEVLCGYDLLDLIGGQYQLDAVGHDFDPACEERKETRYELVKDAMGVIFRTQNGGTAFGDLVDLSVRGARILCDDPPAVGDVGELEFRLSDVSGNPEVRAIVRHVTANDVLKHFGVEFLIPRRG